MGKRNLTSLKVEVDSDLQIKLDTPDHTTGNDVSEQNIAKLRENTYANEHFKLETSGVKESYSKVSGGT